MKHLFFAVMACVCLTLFTGCSKDDEEATKTITNLSGVTWYKAQVWFKDAEGGELSGYKDVGTIDIGDKCSVSTDSPVFYINAKDASGKMVMSKDIHFSNDKATVTQRDLY